MTYIDLPPYAQAMGMEIDGHEDGIPIIAMDFADRVTGRPGYLHGGAIGGLLEMAGFAALHAELDRQGLDVRIKPVNINIEFLRGGIEQRTFAKGTVVRSGRRIANVRIEAWQGDASRPLAACWMNFQLSPKETPKL
ncbi:PaaI family thioesterase [Novosphingobium nitrogenifigens]|nr:PaaI family thioesterase [Novosphingobium nitrogenifigens]